MMRKREEIKKKGATFGRVCESKISRVRNETCGGSFNPQICYHTNRADEKNFVGKSLYSLKPQLNQ